MAEAWPHGYFHLANNISMDSVLGKESWICAAKWQTERKLFRKMSTRPLTRAPPFPWEVSPSVRLRELTDTLPPCPALLLCGCHGPALQSARPTPCGPAERQPAAHLPALSHQTLRWKQMQTYLPTLPHRLLLAPPMLGCPWLLSPRSPPLQAFPIPGPGPCRPG